MRGFTIIELLVVVALTGILVGIAVPAFTNFRTNSTTQTGTADFISVLETAKQYAGANVNYCNNLSTTYTLLGYNVITSQNSNAYEVDVKCQKPDATTTTSPIIKKQLPGNLLFTTANTIFFPLFNASLTASCVAISTSTDARYIHISTGGVITQDTLGCS